MDNLTNKEKAQAEVDLAVQCYHEWDGREKMLTRMERAGMRREVADVIGEWLFGAGYAQGYDRGMSVGARRLAHIHEQVKQVMLGIGLSEPCRYCGGPNDHGDDCRHAPGGDLHS